MKRTKRQKTATKVATRERDSQPFASDSSEILLARTISNLHSEWRDLVLLAESAILKGGGKPDVLAAFLSKQTGVSADSIRRKLEAILHQLRDHKQTVEQVTRMGQAKVMSAYQKAKLASRNGPYARLSFAVPATQRPIIIEEMLRIREALGLKESESLWDFILSLTRDLNEAELRHFGGKSDAKTSEDGS